MSAIGRSNVASSFAAMQGALIEETYLLFQSWEDGLSAEDNLLRARESNVIASRSDSWFSDITRAILRRLDPLHRDQVLVQLARQRCELDVWKPLLLWHMTRDEFLLRDFLVNWLYPAFVEGRYQIRPIDLGDHLKTVCSRGAVTKGVWTEFTRLRVARELLRTAAEFGLLKGGAVKEFASYHLPEASFIYLLHALRDEQLSPSKVLSAPDWHMFLMSRTDVERELLRLHQFRKVDYQVAGSLIELSLPCSNAREYAQRMVA